MAEPTLSQSNTDLVAAVGRFMGFGDPAAYGAVGTYGTSYYHIDKMIQSGVRRFVIPPMLPGQSVAHSWSFLKPTTTLETQDPYSTGTITVVNGVATLAGGTWPTWAANGVLNFSARSYPVTTRDTATQLTLGDLTVDADALTTYSLDQRDYDLPDAFGYLEGNLTYEPNVSGLDIRVTGEGEIRRLRMRDGTSTGRPYLAAVRSKALMASPVTVGQRQEILFHPAPSAAYVLSYKFHALPDKLNATDVYTYGGMAHAETLLESCLSVAEERENDGSHGPHWNAFMERLAASISFDRRLRPQYLGYNGDRSDERELRAFRHETRITTSYNGPNY